jgi:hypothetical protein
MRTPSTTSPLLARPKLPTADVPEGPVWSRRRVLLWGGLVLLLLLALGLYDLTAERRAIEKMEPQARAALYQETWKSFRTLCQEQTSLALASRCREQAQFIQSFPECDEACRQQLSSAAHPQR